MEVFFALRVLSRTWTSIEHQWYALIIEPNRVSSTSGSIGHAADCGSVWRLKLEGVPKLVVNRKFTISYLLRDGSIFKVIWCFHVFMLRMLDELRLGMNGTPHCCYWGYGAIDRESFRIHSWESSTVFILCHILVWYVKSPWNIGWSCQDASCLPSYLVMVENERYVPINQPGSKPCRFEAPLDQSLRQSRRNGPRPEMGSPRSDPTFLIALEVPQKRWTWFPAWWCSFTAYTIALMLRSAK